jgi:hypothetical protein
MILHYRKKPVVIEAVQWTGRNGSELAAFLAGTDWVHPVGADPQIRTLEGDLHISEGDYVIRGVQGEFYPCKPDIFEQTYEPVEIPEPAR